tara:strand:- start:213 stop:467 length:255 start_codon:yes stop_codon:yes gene_type:complete
MRLNDEEAFEYVGIDDLTFRTLRFMQHDELKISVTEKEYKTLMHDMDNNTYSFTINPSNTRASEIVGPNGLQIIFNVKEEGKNT